MVFFHLTIHPGPFLGLPAQPLFWTEAQRLLRIDSNTNMIKAKGTLIQSHPDIALDDGRSGLFGNACRLLLARDDFRLQRSPARQVHQIALHERAGLALQTALFCLGGLTCLSKNAGLMLLGFAAGSLFNWMNGSEHNNHQSSMIQIQINAKKQVPEFNPSACSPQPERSSPESFYRL